MYTVSLTITRYIEAIKKEDPDSPYTERIVRDLIGLREKSAPQGRARRPWVRQPPGGLAG